MDPLNDPRVADLLEKIEAVRVLSDPAELTDLYAELGTRVHALWQQAQQVDAPQTLEYIPTWGDLPDEDDLTDIPDPSSFLSRPAAEAEPPGPVVRLDELRQLRATGNGPLSVTRGSSLSWREPLDELLDLIAIPGDLADPSLMPSEASTVQWASGELQNRIARFPEPVRQALLGLLAVRARNLASNLDVDIGPKMALDRLKRIRSSHELPWVVALLPNARPETGSWVADARAFWELLGR